MRRNNEERLLTGQHNPTPTEDVPPMANPMDFVAPTQIVELPSRGKYPQNHPLHNKDSIEIKYMTAKDEDVLSSRSLLKKGLAIDRLIRNLIKDPSIDAGSLYIGDRNAIMINARASAYGSDYKTTVQCPACGSTSKFMFDLHDHDTYYADEIPENEIKINDDYTYEIVLPLSKIVTKIRPLTGKDELYLIKKEIDKKSKKGDSAITDQMKLCVLSFNGYDDEKTINYVIDNMVATDARVLRDVFKTISPDIIMQQNFVCKNCEHEEVIDVPFGTDFFWPDR